MTGGFLDTTVAQIAGTLLGAMMPKCADPYDQQVQRAVMLARMVVEETKRTTVQEV